MKKFLSLIVMVCCIFVPVSSCYASSPYWDKDSYEGIYFEDLSSSSSNSSYTFKDYAKIGAIVTTTAAGLFALYKFSPEGQLFATLGKWAGKPISWIVKGFRLLKNNASAFWAEFIRSGFPAEIIVID